MNAKILAAGLLTLAVAVSACTNQKHRSKPAKQNKITETKPSMQASVDENSVVVKFHIPEKNGETTTYAFYLENGAKVSELPSGEVAYLVGENLDTVAFYRSEGELNNLYIFGRNDQNGEFDYIRTWPASDRLYVAALIENVTTFAKCKSTSVAEQFKSNIDDRELETCLAEQQSVSI